MLVLVVVDTHHISTNQKCLMTETIHNTAIMGKKVNETKNCVHTLHARAAKSQHNLPKYPEFSTRHMIQRSKIDPPRHCPNHQSIDLRQRYQTQPIDQDTRSERQSIQLHLKSRLFSAHTERVQSRNRTAARRGDCCKTVLFTACFACSAYLIHRATNVDRLRVPEPIVAAMDMVVAVRAYSIQRSKWA